VAGPDVETRRLAHLLARHVDFEPPGRIELLFTREGELCDVWKHEKTGGAASGSEQGGNRERGENPAD
jgi:hypothetical protein